MLYASRYFLKVILGGFSLTVYGKNPSRQEKMRTTLRENRVRILSPSNDESSGERKERTSSGLYRAGMGEKPFPDEGRTFLNKRANNNFFSITPTWTTQQVVPPTEIRILKEIHKLSANCSSSQHERQHIDHSHNKLSSVMLILNYIFFWHY